jgi:hypothetical protein
MLVQYYGRVMGSDWDEPLDDLRWHWGEAYLIHYLSGPGRWVAQRRDSHATMSADGPDGLLDLIRADYAARPVSRRIAGADRPQAPDCRFRPEG